jgi:hypothetical protein
MSIHRSRRLGRVTARRLLRGEKAGPDRLAELLAAAAAPAGREELPGEEAAVTAFRAARLASAVAVRRPSTNKTALTLKAAAAALVVTAAGGVALAAGHLPGTTDGGATPAPQRRPGHTFVPRPSAKPSPTHVRHSGTGPSPSLTGLCHAYRAGDDRGKALDNPAFTHLVTVAGGKNKVAAYCAALLKPHPGKGHASSHPGGTHHPAGRSTAKPSHPAH